MICFSHNISLYPEQKCNQDFIHLLWTFKLKTQEAQNYATMDNQLA